MVASGIGLGRRGMVDQMAQIDEMFLTGGAFFQFDVPPFGDEGLRGQSGHTSHFRLNTRQWQMKSPDLVRPGDTEKLDLVMPACFRRVRRKHAGMTSTISHHLQHNLAARMLALDHFVRLADLRQGQHVDTIGLICPLATNPATSVKVFPIGGDELTYYARTPWALAVSSEGG